VHPFDKNLRLSCCAVVYSKMLVIYKDLAAKCYFVVASATAEHYCMTVSASTKC